ncbi:hypothetical protein SDC9_156772 [bioreactor metagenome]|uniref:Uncharacterized protein n=1 Tax=bioreactor metagenome TaxID=1076179 RepID=A0A645F7H8_9ZZZZ
MIEHRNLQRQVAPVGAERQHLIAHAHLECRLQIVLAHRLEQGERQFLQRIAGERLAQKLQHDTQFAHADHGRHRRPLGIPCLLAQRLFLGKNTTGDVEFAQQFS